MSFGKKINMCFAKKIKTILSGLVLFFSFFFSCFPLFAEGTQNVSPTEDDWVILELKGGFASYGTAGTTRGICIEVLAPDETIYLALSRLAFGNYRTLGDSKYDFRIVDQTGAVVHGPFEITSANVNGSNYNDVFAGPDLGAGVGYDVSDAMYRFSPGAVGTYCVEFNLKNPISGTGFLYQGMPWWDFSVADSAGDIKEGRLYSKNWTFRTPCDNCVDIFSQAFNGKVFVLTDIGFVHRIDFAGSGFKGLSFALAFNHNGPGNSGNGLNDRKSVNDKNSTNPEYQIFLNDPDPALYPEPSIGAVMSGPSLANPGQCDTIDIFCFEFEISQPGVIELILDLDGSDSVYTENTADLTLFEVNQTQGGLFQKCVMWDGKDGLGNPVNLYEPIPATILYSQGQIHFMYHDVESVNPGYVIDVIHPASAVQFDLIKYDDSNLDPMDNDPNIDMDQDASTGPVQKLVELDGCETPCHAWSRFGTSQSRGYGESNTINSWWSGNLLAIHLDMEAVCRADTVIVEKRVIDIANAASGTEDQFDVTFEILIKNEGTTTYDSLRLFDDLSVNLGAEFIGLVSAPTITTAAGTPVLPGVGVFPNEIFDGESGQLNPDDVIRVEFTAEVAPLVGGSWSLMSNQAFYSGINEFKTSFTKLSDDPNDPTSEDDPTVFGLPKIGLAKRITNLPGTIASSGRSNAFDITYELVVENLGDTPLSGISLVDDLETQMGAAFIQIVTPPSILPTSTAAAPGGIEPAFTGKGGLTELLDQTSVLNPGETIVLNFTIEVAPYETGAIYDTSGYLKNQALVSANFSSAIVNDLSDSGSNAKDNTASSGNNSGELGDTGGSDDPTLFPFEFCPAGISGSGNPYIDCNSGNCVFPVVLIGDCYSGLSVQNPQPGHTYAWYFDVLLLPGETASSISISGVPRGVFRVDVTSNFGCVFTDSIFLDCCNVPSVPAISGN